MRVICPLRSSILLGFLTVATLSGGTSAKPQGSLRGSRNPNSGQHQKILLPGTRRDRFPSVEDRVKLYAGNWYTPPCDPIEDTFEVVSQPPTTHDEDGTIAKIAYPDYLHLPKQTNGSFATVQVGNWTFMNSITADRVLWFHPDIVLDCAREDHELALPNTTHLLDPKTLPNMAMYCRDITEWTHLPNHAGIDPKIPLLVQFGDMKHSHIYSFLHLPHFKKFRSATNITFDDSDDANKETCYTKDTRPALKTPHSNTRMQPLLWKLATSRHYKFLKDIVTFDVPWNEKKPMAIFRGQLTGSRDFYDKDLGDLENCYNMARCRLVYESDNSTLVDAKITTTRNRLPDVLNNVSLVVQKTPVKDHLRYKAIIMLEGNDVASGLKWALLSQSVVMMPVPRHTSWAMEELLEPYVHYVPIKDDLSDVEQQMEWIVANGDVAWKISQRATLWMEDLCYHPDAAKDDILVKEELLRRYAQHFRIVEDETIDGGATSVKEKKKS